MASLYKKTINGKPYWYLREMARVDGKPKMVSERYLGSAADIEALHDAREAELLPSKLQHLGFGDTAAVWEILNRLDVAGIIDDVVGARRSDAGASVGTYLALAALNRVVAPTSKLGFADWWKSTAADRFTKVPASVLDHRRFWDAMHKVTEDQLAEIEQRLAVAMITTFNLNISALALDMTNFATYIDSANDKAPIAQRGKAKQKRTDLRLVGLGLVVTRDGGVPLVAHAYPGNRPDVTQFPLMIDLLSARHAALAAQAGRAAPAEMTVVFDAGQNSLSNFVHVTATGLSFVGSIPPSVVADLLALPASERRIVDKDRFGGLSAVETRRTVYGSERRVILTHSPTLHDKQAVGFVQTLSKAEALLTELAATLARGKTRRSTEQVTEEIRSITHDYWVRRILTWDLTGTTPATHQLTFTVDDDARLALEAEVFGKRVLVTDQDDWPIADVVAAYRSQSDAEFSFRQLKDPHVVSFSPMHHWTEHNIRVHTFTCVLALQIAHLMRRQAEQDGLHLSVRELLDQLEKVQETVMIFSSTGGRPKARRMLTTTTPTQDQLAEIFNLAQWAPKKS
ncbi:IS1634 family transposase [Cryobacterium psychrophilum]|uniref:IS1634 family transposase n=1 Tax=Cryobacterium psychrophilum TaxID=41988 RepID=A0A4Y8KRB3_9MICO|nr:IS1634 family transposase [Cryobacterium psychrophilum]TDW31256.1 transposase [Cryobacterium psychrophilum]TFD78454.1 IS1634 family transposase [Cryobacterium psychrophilum]